MKPALTGKVLCFALTAFASCFGQAPGCALSKSVALASKQESNSPLKIDANLTSLVAFAERCGSGSEAFQLLNSINKQKLSEPEKFCSSNEHTRSNAQELLEKVGCNRGASKAPSFWREKVRVDLIVYLESEGEARYWRSDILLTDLLWAPQSLCIVSQRNKQAFNLWIANLQSDSFTRPLDQKSILESLLSELKKKKLPSCSPLVTKKLRKALHSLEFKELGGK
jgi:hypothetical protein